MTIAALPAWPTTGDPAFDTKADALGPALQTFITETNATAAAMSLNSTTDTSTTSNTIGTGSKSFTVSASKSFQLGMYLVIADTAAPSTNSMVVQVTSYNIGTGALVVSVVSFTGSGTKTAWTISLTASINVSAAVAPMLSAASTAAARGVLGVKMTRRRNKWINGNIAVDVRNKGAAKTLTAGAAPVYTVDRIYASCTGANATVQQTVNGNENRLLVTGSAGCTGVTIGTRIISENMGGFDLATGLATLSALISANNGTIISWSAYVPSSGVKNAFGTLASPTRTLVASGTYTYSNVNQSESRLMAELDIQPGTITFTGIGIEPKNLLPGINIELSVGTQINGASVSFGELQLEPDYVIANWAGFEDSPHEEHLRDCAFYCRETTATARGPASAAGQVFSSTINFEKMYKAPTSQYITGTGLTLNSTQAVLDMTDSSYRFEATSVAGGDCYAVSRRYLLDAELN